VREVCDFILKAQGKFDDAMKLYLDWFSNSLLSNIES
jgi:hypothetical protein